jgi:hypothetical protein
MIGVQRLTITPTKAHGWIVVKAIALPAVKSLLWASSSASFLTPSQEYFQSVAYYQ